MGVTVSPLGAAETSGISNYIDAHVVVRPIGDHLTRAVLADSLTLSLPLLQAKPLFLARSGFENKDQTLSRIRCNDPISPMACERLYMPCHLVALFFVGAYPGGT